MNLRHSAVNRESDSETRILGSTSPASHELYSQCERKGHMPGGQGVEKQGTYHAGSVLNLIIVVGLSGSVR